MNLSSQRQCLRSFKPQIVGDVQAIERGIVFRYANSINLLLNHSQRLFLISYPGDLDDT